MDYYELEAEGRGYFFFSKGIVDTPTHFHSASEFVFVRTGALEVTVGGEKRILRAGQACFSEAFCVHSYAVADDPENSVASLPRRADVPTGSRYADGYVLLGDKEYFNKFFRERGDKTFPAFFEFSDFSLLDELYALRNRPLSEINRFTVFSGIAAVLFGCLAEEVPLVAAKENKQAAFICEVLQYASENIAEDLSLKSVSGKFGYSEAYFSKLVRRYLGEGWHDYVHRLRVRRTDELLKRDPSKNVLQAAYEYGFDNPATFYRAYKREYGVSPKQRG